MPGIEVEQRSTDRGKHLVDLLAEGSGRQPSPEVAPAPVGEDPTMRAVYVLGGVSFALLFTGIVTVALS